MSSASSNIHTSLQGLLKPLSQVVADPHNARRHDKKSIDGIKLSMLQYGQVFPILVNKTSAYTFTCVAGSGRVTAAKELGWEDIACVEWDGTLEQAKAFAIVDNKTAELSSWDSDALGAALSDLIDTEEFATLEALGIQGDLVNAFDGDGPEKEWCEDSSPSPAVHRVIIHDPDLALEVMTLVAASIEKYGDMVEIK